MAGIKLGYARSVYPTNGWLSAMETEPCIGWSWGLNSGNGLTLTLSAKIMTLTIDYVQYEFQVLPSLSFAFEF